MLGMAQGPSTAKALYEFHLRDGGGVIRKVCAEKPESDQPMVCTTIGDEIGKCYFHCPVRVWDAAAIVTKDVVEESTDGYSELFSSLTTLDAPPSFTAIVPRNHFTVEKVLAKREYARKLNENGTLVVTEVQEMFLQSMNAPQANLEAVCLSREEMIEQNWLWWQVRVDDLQNATEICETVGDLITVMDGVGYNNKGPWKRNEDEAEQSSAVEVPFW